MKKPKSFEIFSHLIRFILVFNILFACSFKHPKIQEPPLRNIRKEQPFEGKRHKPLEITLKDAWFYPMEEKKEFYHLVYDQDKKLVGFSLEMNYERQVKTEYITETKKKKKVRIEEKILTREYRASFNGRARHNTHIQITDNFNHSLEHRRSSLFYIFPRKYLPSIVVDEDTTTINLPNGESSAFKTTDMSLIEGVFKQYSPPTLNKFPDVEFVGKGIVVRVDISQDRFVSKGKVFVQDTRSGETCFVEFNKLFDYKLNILFKFPTDESFFEFLEDECDFLPTNFN